MDTVFLTIVAGVATYVCGQLVIKLVVDPVQEMKKSIGRISHVLIEKANVIANPGVGKPEVLDDASDVLRQLSSELHGHLHLVPAYTATAAVFRLPSRDAVLSASTALIGLSNGVHRANDRVYELNARAKEKVCDSLGIYFVPSERWPSEAS